MKYVNIDAMNVINYITDSRLSFNELEDKFDMCKAFDEFEKRAKNEEQKANIKTMHKNGFDPETIAKALSLDINYVKEVLAK